MDYKVLLHPNRFAIVSVLAEKAATVKELKKELPDIPQAAIYRSISKLEVAGLIQRESEQKCRGAIEVTYGLNFSMEKMQLENNEMGDYEDAAYAVFFAYVHNKIKAHRESFNQGKKNLKLSRFNSTKLSIQEEALDEFNSDVKRLIEKYSTQQGISYQLTTFLVPEASVIYEAVSCSNNQESYHENI